MSSLASASDLFGRRSVEEGVGGKGSHVCCYGSFQYNGTNILVLFSFLMLCFRKNRVCSSYKNVGKRTM